MWIASQGEELQFSGAAMRVPLRDPFYVGIGVCSHNKDTVEKAVFSNVELTVGAPTPGTAPKLYSTIETVPGSGDRRVVYVAAGRLSGPDWSSNDTIVFQSEGRMRKIPVAGGQPEDLEKFGKAFNGPVSTEKDIPADGFRNFSPEIAPDGQNIVFLSAAQDQAGNQSRNQSRNHGGIPEDKDVLLRVLSTKDGKVRVLAKFVGGKGTGPSWSPDSRRIAFISYQWIP
jgi:hypothetical protein